MSCGSTCVPPVQSALMHEITCPILSVPNNFALRLPPRLLVLAPGVQLDCTSIYQVVTSYVSVLLHVSYVCMLRSTMQKTLGTLPQCSLCFKLLPDRDAKPPLIASEFRRERM